MKRIILFLMIVFSIGITNQTIAMKRAYDLAKSLIFIKNYEPEQIKVLKLKREKLRESLMSWVPILPTFLGLKETIPLSMVKPRDMKSYILANNDSKPFLQYIYYKQNYDHDLGKEFLQKLKSNVRLLDKCKDASVNGCSALGVAVLLKDHEIVQKLLDLGFEPTANDEELAYLDLYERTPNDTDKKIILLAGLVKNPGSVLSVLPPEMIRHICRFMIEEEPLIPRDLCKNNCMILQ